MVNTTLKIKKRFSFLSSFFLIPVFVICTFIFTACDIDAASRRDNVNIYSVGLYSSQGKQRACYWKNGVRTDLPSPPNTYLSSADFIAGYGGDIYILGEYRPIDNNSRSFPCYWKNGTLTDLSVPADTMFSFTGTFFVSGGALYAFGFYLPFSGLGKECCWINGIRTDDYFEGGIPSLYGFIIDDSSGYSTARLDNGYFPGGHKNGTLNRGWHTTSDSIDKRKPFYSKNETFIDLPIPAGAVEACTNEIYVSGDDVYATGNYMLSDNKIRSCYWKNETYTDLPLPAGAVDSYVHTIYAYDGNVYTAGYYTDSKYNIHPCYWKNNVFTEFGVIDDGSLEYGRIYSTLIEVK